MAKLNMIGFAVRYNDIDKRIIHLFEEGFRANQIVQMGLTEEKVNKCWSNINPLKKAYIVAAQVTALFKEGYSRKEVSEVLELQPEIVYSHWDEMIPSPTENRSFTDNLN